eukprot:IDg10439t1
MIRDHEPYWVHGNGTVRDHKSYWVHSNGTVQDAELYYIHEVHIVCLRNIICVLFNTLPKRQVRFGCIRPPARLPSVTRADTATRAVQKPHWHAWTTSDHRRCAGVRTAGDAEINLIAVDRRFSRALHSATKISATAWYFSVSLWPARYEIATRRGVLVKSAT